MPAITNLTWTSNMIGCQAVAACGTFFIKPSNTKTPGGVTMFELTLLAHVGSRGYRGEIHQTIGIFEAPPLAKLMAEAVVVDAG